MSRTVVLWLGLAIAMGCGGKDDAKAARDELQEAEQARHQSAVAEEARRRAEAAAAEAVAEATAAREAVETLQRDADSLLERVGQAVDALAGAQNDADRQRAKALLDQLRIEKAELERRVAGAKAKADRAERAKGVKISAECIDNPLAAGCE